MKKMRLKKVLGTSLMAMALMVCSLGMTAAAATVTTVEGSHSILSGFYNSSTGCATANLKNTGATSRRGELFIYHYNANGGRTCIASRSSKIEGGKTIVTTGAVTKKYVRAESILHKTTSLDSEKLNQLSIYIPK